MKHTSFLLAATVLIAIAANAQNVGIGTTTPSTKLTVKLTSLYGYGMENSSTNSPVVIKTFIGSSKGQIGTTSNHPFELMANDGTDQLILMPNGHVGIGIAPESKFDVNGRIRIRQTGNTAGIGFDGKDASNNPIIDRGFVGMVNNDYVGFYGSGGASWGMAMNVSTGNVGIGITTPASKLHVEGTGLYAMRVVNTGASDGAIRADANNGNALLAANSSGNAPTVRMTNAGGGPALTTNAPIGIGLSGANSTLQVGGSLSMPIKVITDNYTATADDYSIHFIPTAARGQNKTLTLPTAVGCKGRIYHISAAIPFTRGAGIGSSLSIVDANGNDIIANSAYNDGNSANSLIHCKVDWGSSDFVYPGKRKLYATVQSTGNTWIILAMDYYSE